METGKAVSQKKRGRPTTRSEEVSFEALKELLNLPADELESNWHRHQNTWLWGIAPHLGGWVQNTTTVESNAYVSRKSIVHGQALVGWGVRLHGSSVIEDNAELGTDVVLNGNCRISGNAKILHGEHANIIVEGDTIIDREREDANEPNIAADLAARHSRKLPTRNPGR